jgi:hypothetical protein
MPRRLKAAALVFLLATICADLLDVHCDVFACAGRQQTTVLEPAGPGAADSCSSVCVPDCFCCCLSEDARPATEIPAPEPVVARVDELEARPAAGSSPVPYHPPLGLL